MNKSMNTEESKLEAQHEQSDIPIVNKRSQIEFEIRQLIYQVNSRYGAYGHIEPSLDKQKEIYDRIEELREQLKNVS